MTLSTTDALYRYACSSDGVLNPQGVRFGSAEIYSVVEEIKSVEDCLAVAQKLGDGDERV